MTQPYAASTRILHWTTVVLVAFLVPVGVVMAARGAAGNFDALTNTLYMWHKFIGFCVLWLVALRIVVKVRNGTPPYPPAMPALQAKAAHALHGLLYVMMLVVPLTGWAGVSAFPALVTIGGYNLPAMPFVPVDENLGKRLFQIHAVAAITFVVLILGHIGAALMHLLVKRDGMFQRMWVSRAN